MATPTCSTISTKCLMRVSMQPACSSRYENMFTKTRKAIFHRLSQKFYCPRTRRRRRRRGSLFVRRRSPTGTQKTTSCLENLTFGSGLIYPNIWRVDISILNTRKIHSFPMQILPISLFDKRVSRRFSV